MTNNTRSPVSPDTGDRIAIIGSTGSIGRQTLEVIGAHPDKWQVLGLTTYKNIDLLEEQIRKYSPVIASVYDFEQAEILKERLNANPPSQKPVIVNGEEGWTKVAAHPHVQKAVFASTDITALNALFESIKQKKQIALANKEMIVTEGEKIMSLARENNVTIIPIDSEHSAIFQCLQGEDPADIEKVILTCSGGPFYGKTKEELKNVTVDEALNHPTWKMGNKITIDSATLMNKGFEIIEAKYLFGLNEEQIEVVIHPQCIVHSLVQFKDGSIKAQIGHPNMLGPITYALSYPKRIKTNWPRLSIEKLSGLTFIKPDYDVLKGPKLAMETLKTHKTGLLRQANDQAVGQFLNKEISFLEIYDAIEKAIN